MNFRLLPSVLLAISCAKVQPQPAIILPKDGPVRLQILVARPRTPEADPNPYFVVFTARIHGDLSSPAWWCPSTSWSFDDGSISDHPAEECHPDSGPVLSYYVGHLYRHSGPYTPRFTVRYSNGKQFSLEGRICVITCSNE